MAKAKTDLMKMGVVVEGDGRILFDAHDLLVFLMTDNATQPKAVEEYRHHLAEELARIIRNPFHGVI